MCEHVQLNYDVDQNKNRNASFSVHQTWISYHKVIHQNIQIEFPKRVEPSEFAGSPLTK